MAANPLHLKERGMGNWLPRITRKTKGSQTAGVKKGIRPTQLQKFMCRRNRSWKRDDYELVMNTLGQRMKGK